MSNRRKISMQTSRNEFIRSATNINARNLPRVHRRGGEML